MTEEKLKLLLLTKNYLCSYTKELPAVFCDLKTKGQNAKIASDLRKMQNLPSQKNFFPQYDTAQRPIINSLIQTIPEI